MEKIMFIASVVGILLPIVVQGLKCIGAITKNERVKVLATRADIIVKALDQSDIGNWDKKQKAMSQLQQLATEWGYKLSPDQTEQYIESAVYNMGRVIDDTLGNVIEILEDKE